MGKELELLFKPRSVAVVGASREPGKVGHSILKNIIDSGYSGRIYPINPKADSVLGLKAYKSLLEVPDPIDLAVVVVPAPSVPSVIEECGMKGVKFAVVISAGFKEVGGEGIEREKRLVETASKYGVRVVGPNCLGIIDMHTPMNASFGPLIDRKGSIAFVSQSGALLVAILDWSVKTGLGFSKIVSLGNKADLNEAEFLEYLGEDPETKVILLYLESIVNGRRFIEVASAVSRKKPIILLKGGITEAGAKAALSHTGAMAGGVTALKAALKKAGVILVPSLSELFDMAIAFSTQPMPLGSRVGIVTNAGGGGVVTSDTIIMKGLRLAALSLHTIEVLRSSLPPAAAIYNPVDVLGDAKADRYKIAIDALLKDPNVDSVVVILTPQAVTEPEKTAEAIIELSRKYPYKPMLAAFIGGERVEKAVKMLINNNIPVYDMPEKAVVALYGMNMYRESREYLLKIAEHVELYNIDRRGALSIIEKARSEGRRVLLESEAKEIMRCYGVPVAPTILVKTEDEAVEAARGIGYPVVLKIASPDITHKTDVGGVVINVRSDEDVKEAFKTIIANVRRYAPQASIHGVVVQRMVPKGREVIIGATKDPVFGHIIMFGLGGIYTELFKDVSFKLTPLSLYEAKEIIMETKAYTLLKGFRGEPSADIASIVNILLRVSKLVIDIPQIVEMDINPLFVYEEGAGSVAVDVKMVIE
ncbi:MAG: acetate--CoA ligase family protein [Ignisphaera sp.]|uniref:CoA-binding protein n=1 Tax=Ignisphaera aggregans TaxID=334771 RepID=A0A7C4JIX3_9CREN